MKEAMLEAAVYEEQFNTDDLQSKWKLRVRRRSQIRAAGEESVISRHISQCTMMRKLRRPAQGSQEQRQYCRLSPHSRRQRGDTWDCDGTLGGMGGGRGTPAVNLPPKSQTFCQCLNSSLAKILTNISRLQNINGILKPEGKSLGKGGDLFKAREAKQKEIILMSRVTALCL